MSDFLNGKIVYLDEQAIFDFLELYQDGVQSEIIKKISETMVGSEADTHIGVSFLARLKVGFSGNASFQRSGVIESQITSTLLSNFKKIITQEKNQDSKIECLNNIKLYIEKDSPAFYRNITPVLDMIKDINELSNASASDKNNFKGIEIRNIERTLDKLSGYYEIKGIDENKQEMIVRFNITGLRNNYTLSDLTKMNIKLYGIQVGVVNSIDLKFDTLIDRLSNHNTSELGLDFDDEQEEIPQKLIPIYDILLAGV